MKNEIRSKITPLVLMLLLASSFVGLIISFITLCWGPFYVGVWLFLSCFAGTIIASFSVVISNYDPLLDEQNSYRKFVTRSMKYCSVTVVLIILGSFVLAGPIWMTYGVAVPDDLPIFSIRSTYVLSNHGIVTNVTRYEFLKSIVGLLTAGISILLLFTFQGLRQVLTGGLIDRSKS